MSSSVLGGFAQRPWNQGGGLGGGVGAVAVAAAGPGLRSWSLGADWHPIAPMRTVSGSRPTTEGSQLDMAGAWWDPVRTETRVRDNQLHRSSPRSP